MKSSQSQEARKASPFTGPFFLVSVGIFFAAVLVFGLFVKVNRHVGVVTGKVTETYSRRVPTSRKSSYDQEFLVVSYSVNGKEYSKETTSPPGGRSYGSKLLPVYYYEAIPGIAWFYKKSNPHGVYCGVFLVLAAVILAFALTDAMKKARPAPVAAQTKQAKSGAKTERTS